MEIKPQYETFGRHIDFKDITTVYNGILSPTHLFNTGALRTALDEVTWMPDQDILVYFRNLAGGIIPKKTDDVKKKWWESIQEFKSLLEGFSAGFETKYFYGLSGREYSSSEFNPEKKPYQAFLELFNDAVQGFSCFVGENNEGIRISSDRTNYKTIKPGEGLIHDHNTLWTGKREIFFESAQVLYNALERMRRQGYTTNVCGLNMMPAEIRIIGPRGAMIGSLDEGDSFAVFVNNSELERIVQEHDAKIKFLKVRF